MAGAARAERADAQRNRQRLVEAAAAAFATGAGQVSLEAIAREAGVGIGTLYRHFGSREALVEAVYRTELARLCAGAADLLDTYQPVLALRTWMQHYADFVLTKRGMAEALREVIASGAISATQTRNLLSAAVQTLLDAGVAAGVLRDDVPAEDVVAGLSGVLLAARTPEQSQQAGRLLDLLVDGLVVRRPGRSTE